ncbi:MAG: class II fructose-bisphosphate aldolase [Candidatus Moranbacteria bacterium]|nr:class II fructose-bisphosphate aldolase [Candidatus Moranbacteria bacterium]
MIVDVKEMQNKAREGGYAVGAFNTVNLETTQGILEAALEMKSPVVVQMTEKTLDYAGGRAIYNLVRTIAECYMPQIPVGIHLDHGKSFEIVQRATEIGLTSVMYDGSRHNFADNLAVTKKVVDFCHAKGVSVQAELGNVPYLGELSMQEINWDDYMTDPGQAKEFVEHTGIDVLAVAIGNAHGFFRERPEPDYARLEAIAKVVSVPLVMHGASDWEADRVTEVINRGVSCFNVDTSTRLAFIGQLRQSLENGDETDLRKLLAASKDAVKKTVKEKMTYFGSAGKA